MPRPLTRRAALVAAALTTAGTLAACGSDGGASGGGAASSSAGGGDGTFPVTVSTAFGDVEIPEEPQRVVALGWSDAETALALGVQPVGASDWLGFGGEGVGPWAEGLYDEAPEIVETLEPSLEAVAALQPDLILDTRSDGTQERYEQLRQIAPTVGVPEGVTQYRTTWQQQLDLVGQALGRTDEAGQLRSDLEQRFADAAEANPGFDGTEVAVGAYTSEGFGAYVRGDTRVDFMEALGFSNEPAIQDLAGEGFFVPISEEQVPLLDAPLTVVFPIFVDPAQITGNPLWQTLGSVQAGNALLLEDETLVNAFSSGSVLGTGYALDNAVPLFAETLQP
ncbi:iron complex transport system substrate-binding protein [Geodermatophilus bullaregiensis]|uniref:iron-siderophore ABC transporter substrate-binding protein n=1 Tax=Geodermatophilus bullaregiensis TaxID=1564160 RepID=UPI001958E5B0|nr:iron-siderophore ABC transporter substrate-binding protein [Geodermatophilus bullaregiensis]MBM7806424.1 iron complex transport system substrate-binding protein [Geodermatophilus bullaregiensis]